MPVIFNKEIRLGYTKESGNWSTKVNWSEKCHLGIQHPAIALKRSMHEAPSLSCPGRSRLGAKYIHSK